MDFPKFFISFISALLIVVFVSCGDSSDNSVTDQNPTSKTTEISEPTPISQPEPNAAKNEEHDDEDKHDEHDDKDKHDDHEEHDDEDKHDDHDEHDEHDDKDKHDDHDEHDDKDKHDDHENSKPSVKITDKLNREVEISSKPVRVVSLSPTATEMIYKIGGTVVARDSSSRFPANIMELPTVGSAYSPNVEAIVAQNPDLIVIEALTQARFIGQLSQFGIPVFAVRAASLADVTDGLKDLGTILDLQDESISAIAEINEKISSISKGFSYSGDILILISDADRNLYAAKPESYAGLIADLLGLNNLAKGMDDVGPYPGYTLWSGEIAARSNPGYILTISPAPPPAPKLSETLINIPGFNRLPAIQNGNVKELNPILFMQAPGPRIVDALEEMSSLLIE